MPSASSSSSSSFNSRTLGRVRPTANAGTMMSTKFQFTHPGKGATSLHYCPNGGQVRFNSRTLGRVRQLGRRLILVRVLFQFTHPGKGATSQVAQRCWEFEFQFTHPGKGATQPDLSTSPSLTCFNSRTLGRVRLHRGYCLFPSSEFQFTHPGKGATPL